MFCIAEALEEIQRGLDTEDRQTCVYRLQLYKYGIATKVSQYIIYTYLETFILDFIHHEQ